MSLTHLIEFNSAPGFTFDTSVIEIAAGLARLKQNPNGATFWANFGSGVDADYAAGSVTGTLTGGALVAGGLLDLRGATRFATWASASNFPNTQVGTIRLKVKPNYSGAPAMIQAWFDAHKPTNESRLALYHSSDSTLHLAAWDSAGVLSDIDFGGWSPVAGQTYEIELNYDFTAGATRVFIDGVQFGTTKANTLTRLNEVLTIKVGNLRDGEGEANFQLDSIVIFPVVKHTAAYTAPSAPETLYATSNPTIAPTTGINLDGLDGFSQVAAISGSDQVKWVITLDGVDKYWNGSAWSTSDGTYAQANTVAEVLANKDSLPVSSGATAIPKAFLHSGDGTTTPTLTSLTMLYDFYAVTPAALAECVVYGYLRDILGENVTTAKILVTNASLFFSGTQAVAPGTKVVDVADDGKFDVSLVESETAGKKYGFQVQYTDENGRERILDLGDAEIPNDAETVNISTLTFS